MTATTPEQYAQGGGQKCPNCGSTNISADGSLEADSRIAWQTVNCEACDHSWTDEYTLTGYSNLQKNSDLL